MSFFSELFNPIGEESVALIDISAGSVAGAYVRYKEGGNPSILYTRRLPIEMRPHEAHERAMVRALSVLGEALVAEGAPILARHTGSGSAGAILVSIDAPWQETRVRTEHFERNTPFTFTKGMVATALEKTSVAPAEKILADESIIGTVLNGYETNEPYGRKVHRAAVIVLASFIEANVAKNIATTLRGLFHTKNILFIAGTSLRYQAMRTAFPHERDVLILDSTGSLISIELVRKNLLVAVAEVSENVSTDNTASWVQKVVDKFTELAKNYPLPRTIFLLARERSASSLEQALNAAKLGGLWLSDNPPKIVSVLPGHISGSIQQVTTAPPELPLLLMALYWQHRP
ncbi:MAG: hypothetical protein Q7R59_01030 [bacterium]|nr:hypothetical protein [bacterium]